MASSPLLDTFKRGEVNRELRLPAAQAVVLTRDEQLELLVLTGDADPEITATAEQTIAKIPSAELAAILGRVAGSPARFAPRASSLLELRPPATPAHRRQPEVEEAPADEEQQSTLQRIAGLGVVKRIALAMKRTREERAI
jgi:hypothetical protein